MRFDPEDYAFVAHYDQSRLLGQAKMLGKQGLMRLVSIVIGVVFTIIIARSADVLHPKLWQPATVAAAIFFIAAIVVTVVVLLIARASTGKGGTTRQVVLLALLFAASGSLLWPVWMITRLIGGYLDAVNLFVTEIKQLPDQPGLDLVQTLHTQLGIVHVALLVLLGVVAVALPLGLLLLAFWLGKPRALGWIARREINLASIAAPALLLACGAVILLVGKYLVPQTVKKLGQTTLPSNVTLPKLDIFADWLMWLLLAGMMITIILMITNTAKLIGANLLLLRVPSGNALRVDALGLIVDDLSGPRRFTWDANPLITARQHQDLPGSELVIGHPGQAPWAMPFLYLDVLPGSVDSAVRAATQDVRTLDLTPLDKAY